MALTNAYFKICKCVEKINRYNGLSLVVRGVYVLYLILDF